MIMRRAILYLLLFASIGYGIWPYYTIFRLDSALSVSDAQAIAAYVDLPAIQQHYKQRLDSSLEDFVPRDDSGSERMLAWLAKNLARLGDGALNQAITEQWVRDTLRAAAERGTNARPAYFTAAIDFAFFESWNRFVIRLGKLGGETHVVLGLKGPLWRVTDVVR
jgi:hypothetical protein